MIFWPLVVFDDKLKFDPVKFSEEWIKTLLIGVLLALVMEFVKRPFTSSIDKFEALHGLDRELVQLKVLIEKGNNSEEIKSKWILFEKKIESKELKLLNLAESKDYLFCKSYVGKYYNISDDRNTQVLKFLNDLISKIYNVK